MYHDIVYNMYHQYFYSFTNLKDIDDFLYNYNPCNGFNQRGVNPAECNDVQVSPVYCMLVHTGE